MGSPTHHRNINLVIPMAGNGTRFKDAGYALPKPFIDVNGKPMIEVVLHNLLHTMRTNIRAIFLLVKQSHLETYAPHLQALEKRFPHHEFVIIPVDDQQIGAAGTVLYAREHINNEDPLIIANSDQVVDASLFTFVLALEEKRGAGIMVFRDDTKNPKWSYAEVNGHNRVLRVKEKQPISPWATVGIYYYHQGSWFVDAAIDMIIRGDKHNNEYYVCPAYNYMLDRNIGIWEIPKTAMHGLGTPEDLKTYLETLKT